MVFIKGQQSSMKGKHHSLESRKKMSLSRKGRPPWNKGIKTGYIPANKGIPATEEFKKKISEARGRLGKEMPCRYCKKLKYYTPYKIKYNKTKRFYCSSKHQKLDNFGVNNPAYKGKNISYKQKHTRIFIAKGKAENYDCSMKDKTCKGMLEWASISHAAKADIEDFIPLCRSHHRRYDLRNKH